MSLREHRYVTRALHGVQLARMRRVARALPSAASALGGSLGVVGLLFSVGCYAYSPLPATGVLPKTDVAIDLNDVGRVHLGPQIGPEVARVEGRILDASDSILQIKVQNVTYINGSSDTWLGQPVTLNRSDIKFAEQKSLSRSRTVITIALIGAAIAAVLAVVLRGSAGDQKDTGNPGPGQGSN